MLHYSSFCASLLADFIQFPYNKFRTEMINESPQE